MAENNNPDFVETKKIVGPRVEIDTSPPFESVKEAVDRFGGGGAPWIPIQLLRLAAVRHDNEPFDVAKIEEQAMELEREVIKKEQQTHNVLKELEAAKKLLHALKLDLMPELSSFVPTPGNSLIEGLAPCSTVTAGPMFTELNQAKLNLNRTSTDLATIQASLESLNQKLREDKILLGRTKIQIQHSENRDPPKKLGIGNSVIATLPDDLKEVASFEAEQFKRMTEASRYEVAKAMAEIERTKNSIKMAEMRLYAAKKMEEAAKAVEAIALAEKSALLKDKDSPDVFPPNNDDAMVSLDEHTGRQAGELCQTKFIETEKFEETTKNIVLEHTRNNNINFTKFKFRNSIGAHRNPLDARVGDVRERRLVGPQDDVMVGRCADDRPVRGQVSLSQMLREQSQVFNRRDEPSEDKNVEKRKPFFQTKQKFGFIRVPVYNKNNKKQR